MSGAEGSLWVVGVRGEVGLGLVGGQGVKGVLCGRGSRSEDLGVG